MCRSNSGSSLELATFFFLNNLKTFRESKTTIKIRRKAPLKQIYKEMRNGSRLVHSIVWILA